MEEITEQSPATNNATLSPELPTKGFLGLSEKQLQQSGFTKEQVYEITADIVARATVGLHVVDNKGIIRLVNAAELTLLGYTCEEYVGHSITEFHADPDIIKDILGKLLRGESIVNYQAPILCKAIPGEVERRVVYVEINSSMREVDGELVTTRCFSADVTQKVKNEKLARETLLALKESEMTEKHAKEILHLFKDMVDSGVWVN